MTNTKIIEMAIEAELIYNEEGWCGWVEHTDLRPFIERFAALVAAAAKAEERLTNARARAVGDRAYDRYEGETK